MSNNSSQLVQRLWNYCNVLRDDAFEKAPVIPNNLDWQSPVEKEGENCKMKSFLRYCRELIYTKEPPV